MKAIGSIGLAAFVTLSSGCAGLDFGEEGLLYFEPIPYLFVSVNKECVSTATITSVPGSPKRVKFDRGFGSAELSVSLADGMLTSVGQKTDSKIPEAITSIASLGTAIAAAAVPGAAKTACTPSATLYPINNGVPDPSKPINLLVKS